MFDFFNVLFTAFGYAILGVNVILGLIGICFSMAERDNDNDNIKTWVSIFICSTLLLITFIFKEIEIARLGGL